MYGKIFEDIFDSTIADFGGDTIYTFIVMVVKSDAKGFIRMTATALSRTMGKDVDSVNIALANLEASDPESSTPDYDGRRIIPLKILTDGVENRGWWVVNKEKYAHIAKQADRTVQNRQAQQRKRDKDKQNNHQASAMVSNNHQASDDIQHIDKDIDVNENKDIYPDLDKPENKEFNRFLKHYPQRSGVLNAVAIWHRDNVESLCDVLINDVQNRLKNCARWQDLKFIPSVATYLQERRWLDDVIKIKKSYTTHKADGSGGHESFTNWREYGEIHNIPRNPDESISEYIVRLKDHRNIVPCETKKANSEK